MSTSYFGVKDQSFMQKLFLSLMTEAIQEKKEHCFEDYPDPGFCWATSNE